MIKKLNVTKPTIYFSYVSDLEAVLYPGMYIVTSTPGGAGYGGHIDQTHWRFTLENDGHYVDVPLNSLEQTEASSGVFCNQ